MKEIAPYLIGIGFSLIIVTFPMYLNGKKKIRTLVQNNNAEIRQYIEYILEHGNHVFEYNSFFGDIEILLSKYRHAQGDDVRFKKLLIPFVYHWLCRRKTCADIVSGFELSQQVYADATRQEVRDMVSVALSAEKTERKLIELFAEAFPGETRTDEVFFAQNVKNPIFIRTKLYPYFFEQMKKFDKK